MSEPGEINFDTLKPEEFENYLPELFASGDGKVSQDPRLKNFLARNPDCAALVNDLETIAETARSLFEPVGDPSEKVWDNIQSKLREESGFAAGEAEIDGLAEGE
ncbi:MAG TPA: hypothetical protein VGN01_14110 [Acidobacteriaceae bacterium]